MRWSVGTPVVIEIDGKQWSCLLKDISASGAAINIVVTGSKGDPATLLVSKSCSIPSEIVRTEPRECGLAFKVEEQQMNTFDQYIISGIDPSDW